MSEHDELGELLHRIAATVGDPPEHGLERVDARRRRRTRHRRGAVAAAVALAAGGVATSSWLAGLGGEDANLAAGETTGTEVTGPEWPDVVQVNCSPSGLEVPVGHIKPQADGLHLMVHNGFLGPTDVWVIGDTWNSGRFEVDPGDTDIRQPVPPGVLTVGCMVGGVEQELRVDLVDPEGLYKPPKLSCPAQEYVSPPLPGGALDPTPAAKQAGRLSLGEHWRDGEDRIESVTGYPEEYYAYETTNPRVRLERDGKTLAFIYLADENMDDGRSAEDPWAGFTRIEACRELTEGQATANPPPTSTVTPPP